LDVVHRRAPEGSPDRWGATVGAFVRWVLRSWGVGTASLRHPGRIAVTRTHLDVVLPLETVDLDLRLAGLDRDPGWVPSLGRIVLFHFADSHPGAGAPR
jgi:hypothetical protein